MLEPRLVPSITDAIRESAAARRKAQAEAFVNSLAPLQTDQPEAAPDPAKPQPQAPKPQPDPQQPAPLAPARGADRVQPQGLTTGQPQDTRPFPGDMSDAGHGDLIYDAIDGFEADAFFELPLRDAQEVLQLQGRDDPLAAEAWGSMSRLDRARVIDTLADSPDLTLPDAILQVQQPADDSVQGGQGDDRLTPAAGGEYADPREYNPLKINPGKFVIQAPHKPDGSPEDDYFRDEVGDEEYRRYKSLTPYEQWRYMNDPANGFVPPGSPTPPRLPIDPTLPMSQRQTGSDTMVGGQGDDTLARPFDELLAEASPELRAFLEQHPDAPEGVKRMLLETPGAPPSAWPFMIQAVPADAAPDGPQFSTPERAREFEDMTPEMQDYILEGLKDGVPEDDLFNPDGMDLRELLNDTIDGGQGDDTLGDDRSLAGRVAGDVLYGGLVESPTQITAGFMDGLFSIGALLQTFKGPQFESDFDPVTGALSNTRVAKTVEEIDAESRAKYADSVKIREAQTVTGGLVRGIAQFVTGFAVGGKALKGVGWAGQVAGKGRAVRAMTQAALSDFMAFDGHEARLSDLIQEFPALQNPVTEYLQSDMDDTELEGRLKNVMEGGLSDVLLSGLATGLRGIKLARKVKDAGGLKAYRDASRKLANDTRLGENILPDAGKMDVPDAPLFSPVRVSDLGQDRSPRALGKEITAYLKGLGQQVDADDPLSVSLDQLRRGRPNLGMARPVAHVVKGLGGIDPRGPLAAELRMRDITPRTFPALFKVGGLKNLDNIPVSEQPIFQLRNLDDGNGYVPEQAWIDALESEMARRPWQPIVGDAKQIEADALDVLADDLDRMGVDWRNATDDQVREAMELERREALDMEALDALVDGQPKPADVQDLLAQAKERRYLRDREISRLTEDDAAVRMAKEDGRQALVSPSPDQPGKWRVTFLDEKGPAGHSDADTKEAALARAMEDSYFAEGAPDELRTPLGDIPPDPTTQPRTEADLAAELAQRDLSDNPHVSKIGEGKSEVYVNWGRIASEHDVRALVQRMADMAKDEIDEARRGKRSNETTKEAADKENAWALLAERRKGDALNAEQTLAMRRLWTASAERLAEAARAVSKAPTPENAFMFRRSMALHGTIQREVIATRTETARALQQWAIPAGPTEWVAKQMQDMVSLHGDVDVSADLAKKISELAEKGEQAAIDHLTRNSAGAATFNAIAEYWVNAILSGPHTHMRNIISNVATAFQVQGERAVAARIGQLRGSADAIEVGEASAALQGLFGSVRDGFRNAGRSFKTGESGFGISKIEMARMRAISTEALGNTKSASFNAVMNAPVVSHGINALGAVIGTPGRALVAEDEFFKTINFRAELQALAFRQATQEVRAGALPAADKQARIAALLDEPDGQMMAAAREAAQYATFTNNPGRYAAMFNKFRSLAPITRFVMPFINTPANILRFATERSPAAPLLGDVRADIRAGGARADLALAKMGLGSAAMMMAYDAAMNGQITGTGPTRRTEREALYRQGWRPNSIKVGDRYFAFQGLDPIGAIFGVAANMAEMSLNAQMDPGEEYEEAAYRAMGATGAMLMDKGYVQGFADLFGFMSDPTRYADSYMQRLQASFVPSIVRSAENIWSPELNAVSNTLDRIKSRIPGLSADLPVAHDFWGKEVSYQSGLGRGYDAISPVYSAKLDPEPIDAEFMQLNYFPGMPSKTITDGGVKFPLKNRPDVYQRYLVLRGQTKASDMAVQLTTRGKPNAVSQRRIDSKDMTMLEALNALVTGGHAYSEEYAAGSPDEKKKLISQIKDAYQEGAKAMLMDEFPDVFGNPVARAQGPSAFSIFVETGDAR